MAKQQKIQIMISEEQKRLFKIIAKEQNFTESKLGEIIINNFIDEYITGEHYLRQLAEQKKEFMKKEEL